MTRVDGIADAGFTRRYRGSLHPRDAARWALDPTVPALDGSASPQVLLEARRRGLYRAPADVEEAARFAADAAAWDRELALARAALADGPVEADAADAAPSVGAAGPRRRWRLAAAVGAVLVVVAGIALLAHPSGPPSPPVAAGVPGVLVARASADGSVRYGSGLDGAGRIATVVVTCQGAGTVEVRLTDGTDARFACIAAFPRTAVAASDRPLRRFGWSVRVQGHPGWAMTISR